MNYVVNLQFKEKKKKSNHSKYLDVSFKFE